MSSIFYSVMPKTKIWERIESLPGSDNLAEFCRGIGLNYETFKKSHSRNNGPPDSITLNKIARHFKLDLGWLITGTTSSSVLDQRIGKKLKQFRKKKGWTLEEMGKHVSLFPQVLQHYENGDWAISTDLLNELARKLNIPPNELLLENGSLPAQVPELKVIQPNNIAGGPEIKGEDYVSIPLTDSSIAAGQPIIQENNIEDYVLLHIRAAEKRRIW